MKPWFPPETSVRVATPEGGATSQLDRGADDVRTCLFKASFIATLISLILPFAMGMRVNGMSFVAPFVLVPSASVLWLWASWRRRYRVRAVAEIVVVPLLLSLPVLVLSYAAMRMALPLQDARLESWDAALGFRALDFIGWLNGHPRFAYLLSRCYSSFFPQLLLLPIALVATGRVQRAYEMTFVILLLGIFGSAVCMFFPAEGVYVHHQIANGAFENVQQSLGYFNRQLDAVRSDPNFVLDVGMAQGIVAFPSGHAAVAVMCAWAAWPFRWVRWPLLLLNVGMIISAIPQGAHYLVDLIAGAVVAALSIQIATHLPRSLAARRT